MLDQVSILIPYKPGDRQRDLNFEWIINFYQSKMPETELCIGICNDKVFNKSKAVNSAAQQATRNIFVIADGDIVYDPAIIVEAVELLNKNAWIVPFSKVVNLSSKDTKKLLRQKPNWPLSVKLKDFQIEKYYKNFAGKLNVITRKNFLTAYGFDERFNGWGGEDDAFCCAANTLCGNFKRIDGRKVYHLWHPHIGWENSPNKEENLRLLKLYKKANGNKDQIMDLILSRES
ncbi:galactosyltransferase-related protein [Cytobacillus oceanisediminis]|uniref:galactosyltransferase-related protein n=1 Tax=Cytobacillus oceanisediminis TaxID=665099 RepID=UPI0023D98BE3|nr:galactosyltransferase-related protein [Cytobacillus oceanisediminis]MDF2040258.1 galactosyltransferase-related protein [Cytobacillus oceanisediminis]